MTAESNKAKNQAEEEVLSAIMAFEQILEAMPDDRTSLETLWHAYEQIGDHTKAVDYLCRLARVVSQEMDASAAADLIEQVRPLADQDDRLPGVLIQLEVLLEGLQPADASAPGSGDLGSVESTRDSAKQNAAARRGFNISEELAFAWSLLESKDLTQEEYANVVQDLTEMSASDKAGTVSVLHVLEARAFKNLERIMGGVSSKCGTPIVTLGCFEPESETAALLAPEFMVLRGAVVFEKIGSEPLVAVMNPYDKQLREDVETLTGSKCHFYMATPSDFDLAVSSAASAAKNA